MNAPFRIFIGTDKRQPLSAHVLAHSIHGNTSTPVSITFLKIEALPVKRIGLTEFTYTRYLVPWLCDYAGFALFLDADMVVDYDITDLIAQCNYATGVAVNKLLVPMEQPSAMLFNNAQCTRLTPEYITNGVPQRLADWSEGGVGAFDPAWNHVVGYSQPLPNAANPKLIHYTAGIPIWPETRDSEFADVWRKYHAGMNASVGYHALMGNSVHHKKVLSGEIRGPGAK